MGSSTDLGGPTFVRYDEFMTRQATVPSLNDEQMAHRLEEARDDERDGRLVRCNNEVELREFFRALHQ